MIFVLSVRFYFHKKNDMTRQTNIAIILAGGTGSRMCTSTPKQFLPISGRPIIIRSLDVFQNHPLIDQIYVVIHPDYITELKTMVDYYHMSKVFNIIPGGITRQGSSWNALQNIRGKDEDILVFHDAVRPFVTPEIISTCLTMTEINHACTVAVPTVDTIALANPDRSIQAIPDRTLLWNIQTPQCFKFKIIYGAHQLAMSKNSNNSSDDTRLVLESGHPVFLIDGDYNNIKITTPADIFRAETFLEQRNKMIAL